MTDKNLLCVGCGRYAAPLSEEGGTGAMVDCLDGDGFLWTCKPCVKRLTPKGATPIVKPLLASLCAVLMLTACGSAEGTPGCGPNGSGNPSQIARGACATPSVEAS